jgi:hypothetical protein
MPASVPAMIRTPRSCMALTCSPGTIPVSSITYGAFTLVVGQTKTPRSAIWSASGSLKRRSLVSVTKKQCSIVVSPAWTARAMPSTPCAWGRDRLVDAPGFLDDHGQLAGGELRVPGC